MIAIGKYPLQCPDAFLYDALFFRIHFVKQLFVLLFCGNHIGAVYHHYAIIDPLAHVAAELWQFVHAEPQQSIVDKLKWLLTLELCEQGVPTRNLLSTGCCPFGRAVEEERRDEAFEHGETLCRRRAGTTQWTQRRTRQRVSAALIDEQRGGAGASSCLHD